jgi:NADH:ubiquinone oxidoreductase subunit K
LAIFFPALQLLLAIEIMLYTLILILAGIRVAISQRKPALMIGLPLAVADMHIAWGAGFLWSMIK